jgi:tRNA(Ile)-lysidine synthase
MAVRQALATFTSGADNSHWLIAFSGGADSSLLLDLATHAALALPHVRVTAFYMHHYPTTPDVERQHTLDLNNSRAKQLLGERFAFCEMQRDIAALSRRLRRSWEHTASLVRRRQLERLSRRLGGAQVFTGHQLSDYYETLELRAERGIPPLGWPLLSVRDPVTGFLRPLAFFTREQVRSLAHERGLTWFEDPSNSDTTVARNRIRFRQNRVELAYLKEGSAERKLPPLQRVHPRELRLRAAEWLRLAPLSRARTIYHAWQRLGIVKKFTRNDFARAFRLPFSRPPFFAHTELFPEGEFIVFRRGLGSMALNQPATALGMRGNCVTRSVKLRRPYGHKAVSKIFSERRLSPRQRRLTWLETADHPQEAVRIFFPDGVQL